MGIPCELYLVILSCGVYFLLLLNICRLKCTSASSLKSAVAISAGGIVPAVLLVRPSVGISTNHIICEFIVHLLQDSHKFPKLVDVR